MAWKGIVGQGYTKEAFGDYVKGLTFGLWRPSFVVLHNTAVPTFAQWHDVPGAQRMQNLQSYYRDTQRWSAGPHLFIADDLIWVFNPLTTHLCPGNEISKTSFITQVTAKLTTAFPGEHPDMRTVA